MVSFDSAGSHHYFSLYIRSSEDLEVKNYRQGRECSVIFVGLGILLHISFCSSLHFPLNFMISVFFIARVFHSRYTPYNIFNMRSLVGRHLCLFHLLAIMNTAEMNMSAHVSVE